MADLDYLTSGSDHVTPQVRTKKTSPSHLTSCLKPPEFGNLRRETDSTASVAADLFISPGSEAGPPVCAPRNAQFDTVTSKQILANARISVAAQNQWMSANLFEVICPAVAFQGMGYYVRVWIDEMAGPLSLLTRPRFLDSALRAVALYNLGKSDSSLKPLNHLDPAKQALYEGYYHYHQALLHLQSGVGESKRDKSSPNTLNAAMLLSFYEMFARTSETAHYSHTQGAAALIRSRGPSRLLLTPISRATFMCYRTSLAVTAMLNNVECFLAEECWLKAAASIHSKRPDLSGTQDICEELHVHFAKLPNIFVKVNAVCEQLDASHDPMQKGAIAIALTLLSEILQFRWGLDELYARFMRCLKTDGQELSLNGIGSPYWTSFTPVSRSPFANEAVGSNLCFLWTQMIILNTHLAALHSAIGDSLSRSPAEWAFGYVEETTCSAEACKPPDNMRSVPNTNRLSIAALRAENLKLALSICNAITPLAATRRVPAYLTFAIKVSYYALERSPTAQKSALEILQDVAPSFAAANIMDSPQEQRLKALSNIP